jgi:hypothetical protein
MEQRGNTQSMTVLFFVLADQKQKKGVGYAEH